MVPQVTQGDCYAGNIFFREGHHKALSKRYIRSSKVHKFEGLLPGVYVGTHALNDHAEGRCGSVLIFVNKNFVIVKSLTKITKILPTSKCFSSTVLLLAIAFHHVLSLLMSCHTFILHSDLFTNYLLFPFVVVVVVVVVVELAYLPHPTSVI